MLCVLMIHIVMDIFEIMISMIKHILYVIIIMLIYGIKIIRKMSIFLKDAAVAVQCRGQGRQTRRFLWMGAAVFEEQRLEPRAGRPAKPRMPPAGQRPQ
jgi:DMSO/TMAO reductase YedYZ heme-binding membrane subunit